MAPKSAEIDLASKEPAAGSLFFPGLAAGDSPPQPANEDRGSTRADKRESSSRFSKRSKTKSGFKTPSFKKKLSFAQDKNRDSFAALREARNSHLMRNSSASTSASRHSSRNNSAVGARRSSWTGGALEFMSVQARTAAVLAEASGEKPWWVVDPRDNAFVGTWDVTTSVALLFTAVVTPFEVGFSEPTNDSSRWTEPLFIINRLVDLIFLVDMLLQFALGYCIEDDRMGLRWIFSPRRIWKHYLFSRWFYIE